MATTGVWYINLDHRTDRRNHIEKQLVQLNIQPFTRLSATYEPRRGIVGCGKSHVRAVEAFLQSGKTYGIILEDDFTFRDPPQTPNQFKKLFTTPLEWDVILLAGNVGASSPTEYPFLRRVQDSQTTSGYIVTRRYAPTLLANLKEGVRLLEQHFNRYGVKKHEYCLDIYWKKLQTDRWYIFEPKMGYQIDSYSDIERRKVQYQGV